MRPEIVVCCKDVVLKMRTKGISVSRLAELAKVSETSIYKMRYRKRVQKDSIDAVIKALATLPDNKKKDLWDDKLTCVVKYIPATMGETLDPDLIGNYHGNKNHKHALPDNRTEDEINRRWAYGQLMGARR